MMPSPDNIFENWMGIVDNDFFKTILQTFGLSQDDDYVYRAEAFAMTLSEIQELIDAGTMKYKYQAHGKDIEVPHADVNAYTTIFSPTTDTSKALTAFLANAKKGSPREIVSKYLQSRRISDIKVPKTKSHIDPYYDLWNKSCQLTAFLGPLPDATYAHPISAKTTHPILPVFYHHFGCVVPSYESLYSITRLVKENGANGVIDMASGNGYWTYMLRRMGISAVAVDNMASEYRTMWIPDTVKADGVAYLQKHSSGMGKVLLMVYMITAGKFTKELLKAFKGDVLVVVGTQNANRYTGFADCSTEEYFEMEMREWELTFRIAMPSFAGKDEGMFVWKRKK